MNLTVSYIQERIKNFKPEIGIILGSGLGDFADNFESVKIPYKDIPGFENSEVQGHKGQLIFAKVNGKNTVMMQGRYHFYEGYSMQTVTYPVKILKKLGIKTLIITNAAGAVNENFNPGDLMFITDHINFMGTNPLIGKNDDTLGVRFPDMSEVYSKKLINLAQETAEKLKIKYQKGVYIATTGPSYETPAEIRMAKTLGADAVGMSTVPEAIIAAWAKMNVIGISCICNSAAGVSSAVLSHSDVIHAAGIAKDRFKVLVKEIIKGL